MYIYFNVYHFDRRESQQNFRGDIAVSGDVYGVFKEIIKVNDTDASKCCKIIWKHCHPFENTILVKDKKQICYNLQLCNLY